MISFLIAEHHTAVSSMFLSPCSYLPPGSEVSPAYDRSVVERLDISRT